MAAQQQPDPAAEKWRLKTQAAVAREFDVERSTVHDWIAKGCPGKPGHYDLRHITRWLLAAGPWKSQKYIDAVVENAITRS